MLKGVIHDRFDCSFKYSGAGSASRDAFFLCLSFGDQERRITTRGKPVYVDRYASHLMLCAIAVLFLSAMDAFLTLNILANGGKELNWFMEVLIEDSTEKFVAFKLALTSLALVMLIIHHEVHLFKGIRVRHINYSVLAGYAILIGYELHLIALAMSGY